MKKHSLFAPGKIALFFVSIVYSPLIAAHIMDISTMKEYNEFVANNNQPMVLQFSAPWCPACQNVKEPMEHIAADKLYKEITFVRINIDTLDVITHQYKINSIPTFVFKNNGAIQKTFGVNNPATFEQDMRNEIDRAFFNAENTSADDASNTQESTDSFFGYMQNVIHSVWRYIINLLQNIYHFFTAYN